MTDKKEILLIVEDDPNDEELTKRAIKKNNITNDLVFAHDGAEALEYISGKKKHKDMIITNDIKLILLDLNLPKLNGLEVIKKIKNNKKTKQLPIVIFSSSNEQKDINESYQLGVNGYVQKPVSSIEFTETIKHIGSYWLKTNKS